MAIGRKRGVNPCQRIGGTIASGYGAVLAATAEGAQNALRAKGLFGRVDTIATTSQ